MKWIAIAGLLFMQSACSSRTVGCEGPLRPINTVSAVPELSSAPGDRVR
jgi:hypothetical protein